MNSNNISKSQRNISKSQSDFNRFDFDADCNENKYVCGCGKVYGSYPAFSTHRKSKHNNQTVVGTKVPRNHDPKRGRPSYEFKKLPSLQLTQKQYYTGLSSIQIGLLNLQEKYAGRILRSHQQDFKLQIPSVILEKVQQEQVVVNFIKFTELITIHMQDNAANHLIQFLTKLIIFGVQNCCLNQKVFNQYFMNSRISGEETKEKQQKTNKKTKVISEQRNKIENNRQSISGLSLQDRSIQADDSDFDRRFQIGICLILCDWMNKIGVWNYILRARE